MSLIVLATVIIAGCSGKKQTITVVEQDPRPVVKTAAATQQSVEQLVSFTGTIEAYAQNDIAPAIPGRIESILVEVGNRVNKGQLLVTMDPTAYNQASVQLAQQELDLERMKNVYEVKGISKQQLDLQSTQVEVSRAAVKNLLENMELRSPISGVVTARNYDAGNLYGGQSILTVMQMDKLKVIVNISEQYFPSLKIGMPVEITIDLYPNEKFTGSVSLIHPAIDPATRTFTAEVTIPNAGMKLRPGMFSRVAINFGTMERVIVPDIAIQKQVGTNERYVFVIENSMAVRRNVETGRQLGEYYEIISGLAGGEHVVIAGVSKLVSGVEVKVAE